MMNNYNARSDFYNFSQDLMIDLGNKPHRFMDLKCLIDQLSDIYNKVGNCKCAVLTDRELKFTYLYRIDPDEGVIADCLYPHKNSILGISTHHVFVPIEEIKPSDNLNVESSAFMTDVDINHNYYGYTSIECTGDNGVKYDACVKDDKVWIVFHTKPEHDINIKMNITYIIDQRTESINMASGNNDNSNINTTRYDNAANIVSTKHTYSTSAIPVKR